MGSKLLQGYLLRIFILCCFSSHLFFACTQTSYSPEKTVTLALTQYPKSLDPRITTDATGQRLNQLIFNSLVRVGENLKIVGDAAYRWEYKNKKYTFFVKNNLTFSDGAQLTKEDIEFSFAEFMKPSSPFKSSFELIEKVEVHSSDEEHIVHVYLKKFSAVFLTDLTLIRLLSKKIVQKYGDEFGDHLVGTNVYELTSKNISKIIFSKRENHPLHKPYFDNVVFKIIQDDSTRFLNAYKGSIDIIQTGMPLTKIAYIEKQNKYQIYKYPGPSMNYILLNLKDPDFQSKDFRWALSTAIHRDEIIKYKLEGYATPATSLLPMNNPFHNLELKAISYNPESSKKIINKLKLANKEFVLKTSNNPEVVEHAKIIAAQLSQVGIRVKIQSYEWGTFYGDIKNGNYQMAIMRWVGLSDPDIYRIAFHSKELPPGRNRGFYVNADLDKKLDEGIAIEDPAKRVKHYANIQKVIFDEQIIIPLWYNTLVDIVHKRIQNYQPPTSGDLSPLYDISLERNFINP